jgi:hypothetical protein
MQGDEQKPDKRCGTLGTSGHVTAKSSICNWGVLYKSGVYASKVTSLTLGGLPCAPGCRVRRKLAEGREIDPDRMGEVSRRHSRRSPNVGIEPEPLEAGRTYFAEGLNGTLKKGLNDRIEGRKRRGY